MKNQKGVSLIALIITIIVIIILAAIVMVAGNGITGQANYATFVSEFGDYAQNVEISADNAYLELSKDGTNINEPQKYILAALGEKQITSGDGIFGYRIPVGFVLPDTIATVLKKDADEVVAYLIKDNKITGYADQTDLNFYGDSNGTEYHFVTSDGTVFTIPGFQEAQDDGSYRYYITNEGDYYTNKGKATTEPANCEADPLVMADFNALLGYAANQPDQDVTTSEIYEAAKGFAS